MNQLHFFNHRFLIPLALLFAALCIAPSSLAMDSAGISPRSERPMELITAYVKINVTSKNRYTWCFAHNTGDQPDIWASSYTTCPENSLTGAKTINDVSALVEDCLCHDKCLEGVTQIPTGSLAGIQITGIHCVLPIEIWIPVDIASNGGFVTLYGQTLWLSHYGTNLLLQPRQNIPEFNLTVYVSAWGATPIISGDYAVLKETISPNSFPSYFAQFTGCKNYNNGKCVA